ncbi:MAG TPA: transglycosylase SLT domain-containing protein [Micropepsaceae bacterium]|jgi:hypothetical protein|nr:transglycosylase SLT domain-containing protein [Micropepsaceae bacterium]
MIAETQTVTSTPQVDVVAALKTASAKTGSDFDYLLNTAMRESRLDSHAKSKTSSASGLFQFIEQTWLGLVKRYGDRYGLKDFAGAIRETTDGHYDVASKETRSAILALRQDAQLSACMAGEAANQTKQTLEHKLGREVCSGELYAAHFLGEGGASRLIELNASKPEARADLLFPQAASGNKGAFYHTDGRPKTVAEVYAWTVNSADHTQPNGSQAGQVVVASEALAPALAVRAALPRSAPQMTLANVGHRARMEAPTWIKREPVLTHAALYLRLSPGMLQMLGALAPASPGGFKLATS